MLVNYNNYSGNEDHIVSDRCLSIVKEEIRKTPCKSNGTAKLIILKIGVLNKLHSILEISR